MMTTRTIWSVLLLAMFASAGAAIPDSVGGRPVVSLAPLVEAASPAVVNIRVSQTVSRSHPFGDDAFRRFFGLPDVPSGPREVASAGSGVIVDAERGYILTNHHVVASAADKGHGLREAYLMDPDGYLWVPDVPLD